jgi:Bacterial EndoU nuclease
MTSDRPDDEAGPDSPDQRFRSESPGGTDSPAARTVEARSREEYYEALRAADGKPVDERAEAGDARSDRCGWDSVDATERPPVEAIHISPERKTHILDGDKTGGGHRPGTGKPGKTEFPASWDDKKIIDAVVDVAQRPDLPPKHQERNDRWVVRGTRDDVRIVVIVEPDGPIWTSWPPPGSPGVVKNPKER